MQIKTTIMAAMALLFASVVVADPVTVEARAASTAVPAEDVLASFRLTGVPSGKTATHLATLLLSAESSMNTKSADISAFSVFNTALPSSVLQSVSASGIEYITTTNPPAWYNGLPKDVKSVLISRQSVINKIETSVLKIKSTSASASGNAAGPRATAEVGVMGVIAAGALGVAALL